MEKGTMKYLTEAEEKKLLRTVREIKGRRAERDHMILFLDFNTGLRLDELHGLNVGDVRGKEQLYVRPETSKATRRIKQTTLPSAPLLNQGGEYKKRAVGRTIPLSRRLQAEIRQFIKMKLQWRESIQDDAPLFVSKKGNRISRRALQDLFEHWMKRAELQGYSFHSMRHSFAKGILRRAVNKEQALVVIQKLLGHASLASTGVYIEAGIEEMVEAVEAR